MSSQTESPPSNGAYALPCHTLAPFAELVASCRLLARRQGKAAAYATPLALFELVARLIQDGSLASEAGQNELAERIIADLRAWTGDLKQHE